MKYNKLLLLIPVGMIIFVVICFYILLNILFNKHAMNINKIKNKFNDNEPSFNKVINELENEEKIDFRMDNNILYIHINGQKVKYEAFDKYSKTIVLINKLNLESVYKSNNNTIFIFKSGIGFSQAVAHILNEDNFYTNYKTENIKDNWYYIEDE